jgi:hypothetical protein
MSATNWFIVRTLDDYEAGEFGEIMIGRVKSKYSEKLAPMPLCQPQIPHDVTGREPGPPLWEASN